MADDIRRCGKSDYPLLAGIWERSVRATHSFLSEADIVSIRESLMADCFQTVELFGAVGADGSLTGFIGLSGRKIEMLFIDSMWIGHGYGSRLIDFAIARGALSVDVNEQNPAALNFYLAKGFHMISRDEVDDCGRPFPILHLSM